jgi:serine/threonine-protein kinase
MIEDDGGIKLVDLGVAKASGIKDSLKTAAECVFGTPAYVSPEQALSAHDVDVRADIYSLGIVFFEMITGRRPYEGKDAPTILREVISDSPTPYARDFNSEVPENVAVLVRRMCVKSRDRRICSTKELISELMKLGFENVAPVYPSERNVASLAVVNKKDAFLNQELSEAPVNFDNTLSFETEDVEIQRFVSKLKHKRLLKKKLKILAIGISVVLLVLIIVLLKYV